MKGVGKKNDASTELGRYMLLGWTLLAETCPRCHIPLVENKKEANLEKRIYCVNCNLYFLREKDFLQLAPQMSETEAPMQEVESDNEEETRPFKWGTVLSHMTDQEEKATEQTPTVSPNSIVKEQQELTAKSVDLGEEKTPSVDAENKSDTVTKLLGEKLLQGWTMMNLTCPTCPEVPLMRDVKKRLYCVSCNHWVIKPEEYDPKKHLIVNKDGLDIGQQQQLNCVTTTQGEQQKSKVLLSEDTTTSTHTIERNAGLVENPKSTTRKTQEPEQKRSSEKEPHILECIASLENNLTKALTDLQNTDSYSVKTDICRFITQCGRALSALHRVHHLKQKHNKE